jgi:cell division septal protein FtsQ
MFGKRHRDKAPARGRPASQESAAYLRRARPVPVREGWRSWLRRGLRWTILGVILFALAGSAIQSLASYLYSSAGFTLAPDGRGLHVTGLRYQSARQVRAVFQQDLGGSLAAVPFAARRQQLAELPWTESAAVLLVWPNRLWAHVREREPIAFVRVSDGSGGRETTRLIDRHGVILAPPEGISFSLPVTTGITPDMPFPERRRRLALFEKVMASLDEKEPKYSPLVSEIDVSDPGNAWLTTVHRGDVVELETGEENLRHRFEVFLKYIDGWKREYGHVRSVDLRFQGQVVIQN